MTWELKESHHPFTKESEARKRDMYLTDEFGQQYAHSEEVTGAAGKILMGPDIVYEGSFYFPLPTNGARRFDFHKRLNERHEVVVTAVLP